MLFREIIIVYCTTHTNTLCAQNAECLHQQMEDDCITMISRNYDVLL